MKSLEILKTALKADRINRLPVTARLDGDLVDMVPEVEMTTGAVVLVAAAAEARVGLAETAVDRGLSSGPRRERSNYTTLLK